MKYGSFSGMGRLEQAELQKRRGIDQPLTLFDLLQRRAAQVQRPVAAEFDHSAGAVIADRQRFAASGKPQLSLNRQLPRFWWPERKPQLLKRRDDGRQRGGADVRPFPDLFGREPH